MEKNSNKKTEIVTVISPYQATEQDQLSLEEGDILEVWEKEPGGADAYWWYGQKVIGKQVGWFPVQYVKLIGKVGIAVAGLGGTLRDDPRKRKQNGPISSMQGQNNFDILKSNGGHNEKPQVLTKPKKVFTSSYEVPRKKSVSQTNSPESATMPSNEFKSLLEKVQQNLIISRTKDTNNNNSNSSTKLTGPRHQKPPFHDPFQREPSQERKFSTISSSTIINSTKAKEQNNNDTKIKVSPNISNRKVNYQIENKQKMATTTAKHVNSNTKMAKAIESSLSSSSYQIVVAIADYEATDPEAQLALQMGDLIRVNQMTEEDQASGWWHGQKVKGNRPKAQGWFPVSYVKVLTEEYCNFEIDDDDDEVEDEDELQNKVKEDKIFYQTPLVSLNSSIPQQAKPPQLPPKPSPKVAPQYINLTQIEEYSVDDDSFDDDSDYETDKTSGGGSIVQINGAVEHFKTNGRGPAIEHPSNGGSHLLTQTIAVLSLTKIEAFQLYTQNYPLKIYLKATIATDWARASTIFTTSTAAMKKPPNSFRSAQQYYSSVSWTTNFRMNIYNAHQHLLIQGFDASTKSDRNLRDESNHPEQQNHHNSTNRNQLLLAEASLPVGDLIIQSKHLTNFTKGLPLVVMSDRIETTLAKYSRQQSNHEIKPCLLVKFNIIDLR